MPKTARLLLNLLLTFALLAGSSIPAQAASPAAPHSDPIEPPPQRLSLQAGGILRAIPFTPTGIFGESPAAPTFQNPIPSTCLVYSSLDTTTLEFDLYVYDPQTGQYHLLFASPDDEIEARFNHGCTKILYTDVLPNNQGENLFLINPDGSGQVQLTNHQVDNSSGAWSRDGSKIAFTSDRVGRQAEIYTMNADGSNQVRLTNNGGDVNHNYDGMPAWSPDGSKIAFVSNRTGGYRIWVMNADGSGQVQLSTQPYSFRPQWSPDGSSIVYDSGHNVNGYAFQWLTRMNADGSDQHYVNPNSSTATTDQLAMGWSPDGQYIYYSIVNWVQNSGSWYWTNSWNYAWGANPPPNTSVWITPGNVDWYPSWETYDTQVPVLTLNPLPAVSPSPVTLSWSVQDLSLYHMTFDVQYMDNASPWQNLQTGFTGTSLSFDGVGGHSYGFRIRARDGFYQQTTWPENPPLVTSVEALPPQSRVDISPFSPGSMAWVSWSGQDPGGSGIVTYDVQYRPANDPNWIDLITKLDMTTYRFLGTNGQTYYFRVRAIDRAHNQESWPSSDTGSASTTLYATSLSGTLQDASGNPIPGASPSYLSAPIFASPSGPDGSYQAYFGTFDSNPAVNLSRAGYGQLPATNLDITPDQKVDIYLPPAVNAVTNGGFENSASSLQNWSPQGQTLPVVSGAQPHSGNLAARLGAGPGLSTSDAVLCGSADLMDVDRSGVIYMIDPQMNLYTRTPGGACSQPEAIPAGSVPSNNVRLIKVDQNLTIHVWVSDWYGSALQYLFKPAGGSWIKSVIDPATSGNLASNLQMDADGNWYAVMCKQDDQGILSDYFVEITAGVWSPYEKIAQTYSNIKVKIALGPNGKIAAIWTGGAVSYSQRNNDGSWTAPVQVSKPSEYTQASDLIITKNGETSIVASSYLFMSLSDIYYYHLGLSGVWDDPVKLTPIPTYDGTTPHVRLTEGPDGSIFVNFLFGENNSYGVSYSYKYNYFTRRSPDGVWSAPARIPGDIADPVASDEESSIAFVTIDDHSFVHFIWNASYVINGYRRSRLTYTRMKMDGSDVYTQVLGDQPYETPVSLINVFAGQNQGLAVFYYSNGYQAAFLWPASETGDSSLSQDVAVPGASTNPGLSFVYSMPYNLDPNSTFSVKITAGEKTTTLFTTHALTSGWAHQWLDLSRWAGQTVTLTFTVHDIAGSFGAGAFLDEVSVGSTPSDTWVHPTSGHGLPGGQVVIPLTFGNHGKVPAAGSRLTLTLPADVTFVSASIAPTTTTPNLTWDLADLPAQSGPVTIWVTLQLNSSIPTFTTLPYSVSISKASTELETANNTAPGVIYSSLPIYLPLLKD